MRNKTKQNKERSGEFKCEWNKWRRRRDAEVVIRTKLCPRMYMTGVLMQQKLPLQLTRWKHGLMQINHSLHTLCALH